MRLRRIFLAVLLLLVGQIQRTPAASPARFVPPDTDILVEIPHPRQASDALLTLDAVQKVQTIPQVKELLGSTSYRRFYQLVAWFEKDLGAAWPEILDQTTGNGAVLTVKIGPNPAVLAVLEGKDEKVTRLAFDRGLTVLKGELARRDGAPPFITHPAPNQGTMITVGPEFCFACTGKVILASNNHDTMKQALALVEKGGKSLADNPGVIEAARLLPADCLARVWINMETVRRQPGAPDIYKTPRDPGLTVLFGSYVDTLGRSPWVTAGLVRQKQELSLRIRLPQGREGMSAGDSGLQLPVGDNPGSRPLLEPPGVLYSYSFYLDISRIWTDRELLFGQPNAKGIEQADKDTAKIPLNGVRLSKILTNAGNYHRFVVANQRNTGYLKKPQQNLPAFALVTEMRDPDGFAGSAELALRGVALSQMSTYKLTLVEEKYKDVPLVCYRFAEDKPVPQDETDQRFNFSPCFCRVGKQFMVSSTLELCHDLIDELQTEAREGTPGAPSISRQRIYSAGMAQILAQFEDQLVTQAILDQSVPPAEARAQAKALVELVKGLGNVELEATILPRELRYDIRLK
jgi:hypothetical protein